MADLNSLIAQGAQFRIPPPVDPMGNMPQLMQMRAAQNQNALAQYQLGAAQRTDEQQSALNALARNPNFNPNTPEGMRQAQQYGAPGYALVKSAREASSAGVAQDQARTNLLKEKMAMLPDAYRMADTPEAYAQLQESIHADPVIGPWLNSIGSTREKGVAALQDALTKPNGFDQLRMGSMKSVKDILEGNKPLVVAAGSSVFDPKSQSFVGTAASNVPDAELMTRMGYPLTREGYAAFKNDQRQDRLRTPEEEAQQIRIAQGSRPLPAQARAESAPVAVLDPITKKPILVSREEAISKGMTPANTAEKPMSALQKQAFKKDFANDTSKVQSATNTADELEKLTDELVGNPDKEIKPHPGLGGITGYLGILPSLPKGEAAKAEQKLDTFKGKIKSLGRAIASQEGKLGNMAVQEWQMVSDAVQNISPRAGNLDVQMRDVVRQARDLARNMKEKFDLTYEDTAPAAATSAVAPQFAVNPQTKQRIMSTDGGNTWAPAPAR